MREMRVERERERERNSNTMATQRRMSYINNSQTTTSQQIRPSIITWFIQRPYPIPFLLVIFLFLAWISLRTQHVSRTPPHSSHRDALANLVRFHSSHVAKDNRGWLFDPIALALDSGVSGGAVTCSSLHVGEIRPGKRRGNHRHHDCNETFLIWGAATRFRLENSRENDGYAEVTIGRDEIAVAASPVNTAHALVNIDSTRSIFFLGCQDNVINYNASSTDFNVWKDL
ncbi:hypothetical protein PHAVU_001G101300 [Phaseolus vulgaris]|uniref:Capsular polysaccharide assembling protein CapF C-terminal domain-containing protein n=2 Tax=Phaseolus vulgaris TaxID=3885 RepID=V7CUI2_PHAVU|nr:hypothetical protein PHAVU_001G101300g [Phaseolus vulgaris]ESW33822.1 hypothetical protein PHAVU_001G101300g [Phaseolus vulgaris]